MPINGRTNAVKNKTNVKSVLFLSKNLDASESSGEDERETETDFNEEDYVNFKFDTPDKKKLLEQMRKSIAYVYIRAHSNLPYDDTKPPYMFDTYELPPDMELTKITAAPNGEVNTSFYDYQDKKDIIASGIRVFNKAVAMESEENDTYTAGAYIAGFLKRFEKKENIPNYKERNEVSNSDIVLNKIIVPLSKEEEAQRENYMVVQILFLDESDDFQSIDIYPLIHKIYREYTGRFIRGYRRAIKMADIIKFLYDYLKLKNVVLIDFSCSSTNVENKKQLMIDLNEADLHGGIKQKKTKKSKKTNKSKTNKKKTKKTNKKKTKSIKI
jgi:hypothetical protein